MSPGMATTQTAQSAPTIPPEWRTRFAHNHSALAKRQPELAESLAAMVIPEHVEPAEGRDGLPTFRLRDVEGRLRWFGQSSMPSISARALLADKRYHGGQVALPGVLTGVEPLVIAEGLPLRSAVFVFEAEPLHVVLALHLQDYSRLIESGRIVFVPANDMRVALMRLFERFPGYEMPTFLLKAVQVPSVKLAELQQRLEEAGQAVVEYQTGLVSTLVESLRSRSPRVIPDRPRVAVLGLDADASVIEEGGRIATALDRLGWRHVVNVPDRPDRCHIVSHLRAVAQGSDNARGSCADAVVFVGRGAGTIRALLPESLPVATWITDDRPFDLQSLGTIGPNDALFVSDAEIGEKLRKALGGDGGIPGEAVQVCEPAADDARYDPLERGEEKQAEDGVDVLLVGDLPDDRPEAAHIALTSHVAFWNAARKIARRWADEDRPLDPQRILDEASRTTGISLNEASLRDALMELIRTRVIPGALAHGLVRAVEASRLRGSACGANWHLSEGKRWACTEVIPSPTELNGLYHATSLVVFPGGGVLEVRRALDALNAGASVALRCDAESFRRRFPRLADLATSIHFFTSVREFRTLLKRAGRGSRPLNMKHHTVAARLEWIMDCLRRRGAKA
jgi:hypothetical protein